MPKFFIDRPIFAWVVAIFIILGGLVSMLNLPIAQYPSVAPPTIRVSAVYPGASAEVLDESVLSVIGREMNGAEGMMYMESAANANGGGALTLTFEQGIDPDLAQVDVQNRLKRAEPKLPSSVTQQGVQIDKAGSSFLLVIGLASKTGNNSDIDIGDYAARNIQPELQRITGVGNVELFSSEKAMRIWIDPAKLEGFNLSAADVSRAIANQNIQIPSGGIGLAPNVKGQAITATIFVQGQLANVEEFSNIVVRALPNGASVKLKDVARVELGAQGYNFSSRLNGKPAVNIGIQLTSDGNAMAVSEDIRAKMKELEAFMPDDISWSIPYDSSDFVRISINKVVTTLFEAILLVFLVMLLFLQNIRYTLIPTIVVPIALLGTFIVLISLGMSINILAMFAMVLVIGIVVDDAIVVVENVERIMATEGLNPREATVKAMDQITGAVVGITVVLISVFIPLAFFSGATGNIYRQFSIVMAVSIFFSGFLALSLTPALCATMLKPIGDGHDEKSGFYGWFNRKFNSGSHRYEKLVKGSLKRPARVMLMYVAIIVGSAFLFMRLPTSFLPMEDQGYILVNVQLPPGATSERTLEAMKSAEDYILAQPEVENMVSILGFSFSGQGQNAGLAFVTLKDWSERKKPNQSASAIAGNAIHALGSVRDAFIFSVTPAPIPELGNSSGFALRLQDRSGKGHAALLDARNQLLGMASQSPKLTGMRPEGLEDAPQLRIEINRDIALAQGVGVETIAQTLGTALGSAYINDFPNAGRLQQVIVQADAPSRMQPDDILRLTLPNNQGQLVPLNTFVTAEWVTGPQQVNRYNGYPAMNLTGNAAPGLSSGEAMEEMELLAQKLPDGFGIEWTGQSLEEKKAGSSSIILYAFAILAVFLCLAALYESWSIPFSVILVVPLGILGVLLGTSIRGMENDIYFQVGLITVIGLSAKNAILIIEFAKDLQAAGKNAFEAALLAARLRFRPIIMTSLAFILGVVPLYFSSGASSASQRAVGTSVFWGMLVGTVLSVFLVPVFYLVIRKLFKNTEGGNEKNDMIADMMADDKQD